MTDVHIHGEHDWLSSSFVDEWVSDWSARDERPAQLRRIAVALPFKRSEPISVLDVGGGWGPVSEQVLSYRPNARVKLVDFSPPMLAHAEQHLASFKERVEFAQRDLCDTTWSEGLGGPFDAVVSSLAIHNLRDPGTITRVYSDVVGLLRPSGSFLNLETTSAPRGMLGVIDRRLRADQQGLDADAEPAGGADRPPERGGTEAFAAGRAPSAAPSLANQLSWLEKAGFEQVDCLWRDGRYALLCAVRGS